MWPWRATISGNFYELSDAIADGYADPPANTVKLIPDAYRRTKLYLGRTCTSGPDCRQKMNNVLNNQGAMFVSFIGHGTKTFWAREKIWDVTAASQMANGVKFPIMLPMTCNEGYFHEAARTAQSTSEAAVRLPGNGAVASWAPPAAASAVGMIIWSEDFSFRFFMASAGGLALPPPRASSIWPRMHPPEAISISLIHSY